MSETLADFIANRWRALDEVEKAIKADTEAKLRHISNEREQLQKAAAAAGLPVHAASEANGGTKAPRLWKRVAAEKTIKEAVVEVLKERGRGMTALEILPAVNERLGIEYPRTSLSPQLSRLKADGILTRDGIVWALVPDENEADGDVFG